MSLDVGARAARLEEARQRAARFLASMQRPDGRWLDFRFRFAFNGNEVISSQWVTAYVGASLASGGAAPGALDRARAWLMASQHPGGGWGFSRATPADADSTANALHFFARHRDGSPASEAALEFATGWLLRYWDSAEGGFHTYLPVAARAQGEELAYPGSSWCDVHVSVTALAAEALRVADATRHAAVLERAAATLARAQSPEGFWEAFWWHGRTYSTYQAARVLARLGDLAAAPRAVDWLLRVRHEDGSWGNGLGGPASAFHTSLALRTLLLDSRSDSKAAAAAAVDWLLEAQESDGGFATGPIMRMPRPDVHAPWEAPDTCLLVPLLYDRNRVFTTASVLEALKEGS
jgi:squalene-hopene/tetraprenyl-beta-curcumene cyclase